jgi:hypothetical protein
MIINISKVQLFIACLFITSCSGLGSFFPKPVEVPYSKNVVKFKNGAVGLAPEGYCIGPLKNNSYTGSVVSISFAPMETGVNGKITRSYLANNQKIIKTDYLDGSDLVKVENSRFSAKSLQDTVWRTAKAEKGYVVLAQYFSPRKKNVSDLHQMEILSASIDNFSAPDNLLNVEVSDLNLNIDDQSSNTSVKPKMRPVNKKSKLVTSKIRPKLRP